MTIVVKPRPRGTRPRHHGRCCAAHGGCCIDIWMPPETTEKIVFEIPKQDIGTATISAYTWTVPSGWTKASESQAGRRVQILLAAPSDEHSSGWLELDVTTSAAETLYFRRAVGTGKDVQ